MKRIITEKRHPENKDAVFIIFYAKYNLPNMYKEFSEKEIFVGTMNMRWDGSFGFIGGFVDEKESLRAALKREVKEEIDYELDLSTIEMVCSHGDKEKHLHLYKKEVSFEEIKEIMKNSINAKDFCSEMNGLSLVHFENYGEKGFSNFLKNNFVTAAKEELILFADSIYPSLVSQEIKEMMPNLKEIYEELPNIDSLFEILKEKYPTLFWEKETSFLNKTHRITFSKDKKENIFYTCIFEYEDFYLIENSYDGFFMFSLEDIFSFIEKDI